MHLYEKKVHTILELATLVRNSTAASKSREYPEESWPLIVINQDIENPIIYLAIARRFEYRWWGPGSFAVIIEPQNMLVASFWERFLALPIDVTVKDTPIVSWKAF